MISYKTIKSFILFLPLFFSVQIIDYVPNKETAIRIAEAVWLPIYGELIYKSKPFHAELNNDSVWHVYGTLEKSSINVNSAGDTIVNIVQGGTPHIFINKIDGKILDVYHTK